MKLFNSLFTLKYSVTHKKDYNKIYRLDAYNKKLVKKIKVKGISVRGTARASEYVYFEGINLSNKKKPAARLELEVKQKSGIKRITKNVDDGIHIL